MKVKGRWTYLYRAVDSRAQTIDFLLSAKRDAEAAKLLFLPKQDEVALAAAAREREASRIGCKARREGTVERLSVLDLPPPLGAPEGRDTKSRREQDARDARDATSSNQGSAASLMTR